MFLLDARERNSQPLEFVSSFVQRGQRKKDRSHFESVCCSCENGEPQLTRTQCIGIYKQNFGEVPFCIFLRKGFAYCASKPHTRQYNRLVLLAPMKILA